MKAGIPKDKLDQGHNRFRFLYQSGPAAVVIWDSELRVTDWNLVAESMFGWTRDEAVGAAVDTFLVAPDDRKRFARNAKKLFSGTRQTRLAACLTSKDGSICSCRLNTTVLYCNDDGSGEFVSLIYRTDSPASGSHPAAVSEEQQSAHAAMSEELSQLHIDLDSMISRRAAELASANKKLEIETAAKVRAQAAQIASEQRFRVVFESINAGILIVDFGRQIVNANNKMCSMLGYSRREFIGKKAHDIYPREQLPRVNALFESMIQGQPVSARDIPVIHRDGREVFVDMSGGRAEFDGRSFNIGVFHDVTDRYRTEEELKRINKFLDNIIESSLDAIVVTNNSGHIQRANHAFFALHGYRPEEMLGVHVAEFALGRPGTYRTVTGEVVEIDDTMIADAYNTVLENLFGTGRLIGYRFYRARKDELLVPVEENSVMMYNEKNEQIGALSIMRNITERRRTELELNTLNRELEQRVVERTATLNKEIEERRRTELKLKEREQELEIKTGNLEEINTALKVLLQKREEDREELQATILTNLQSLVVPYLEKLEASLVNREQKMYLEVVKSNIADITSPLVQNLSTQMAHFTATEIQIVNHIKSGRSTKEIASLLHIAPQTVSFHRKNIRKKLDIQNKNINLRTYLSKL